MVEVKIKEADFPILIFPINVYIDGEKKGKIGCFFGKRTIGIEEGIHSLELKCCIPLFYSKRELTITENTTIEFQRQSDKYMKFTVVMCLLVILYLFTPLEIIPNIVLLALIFVFPVIGIISDIVNRKDFYTVKKVINK